MNPTPLISVQPKGSDSFLFIKREDQASLGSHKWRFLERTFSEFSSQGIQKVVLSTTGNAGITASALGKQYGIQVICLMHENGSQEKMSQILQQEGTLILSQRPVRFSKYIAKKHGYTLLRGSQDEQAPHDYESLGREIIEQCPEVDAVINFCTSGTSTLGIAKAFESQSKPLPAFHVVQSGSPRSVVDALHPSSHQKDDESVGLHKTPYHDEMLELIKESRGDAWHVSQQDRDDVQEELQNLGLETSFEGVSCYWVAKQLLETYDHPVVIFSGKQWELLGGENAHRAVEFTDIDAIIESLKN